MAIPATLLQQIETFTEALGKRQREARRQPRIPVGRSSQIVCLDGTRPGRTIRCRLRDISRQGAGVVARNSLPVGERCALELRDGASLASWVYCQVVRCEPLSGGLYLLGLRWTRAAGEAASDPTNAAA